MMTISNVGHCRLYSFLSINDFIDSSVIVSEMSINLRIKRLKQTMFLFVEPFDSIAQVKQKIGDYFQVAADKVALFTTPDKVYIYFIK